MTSLGEYCSAGTIRCNKIIATEADLPGGGGGGGGDIDVDSINFKNTWKIYLDTNSNFILENEAQNIISLSGDAHTGKITLHDFDLEDLANVDTEIKEFGATMFYDTIRQKYGFTNRVKYLGNVFNINNIPLSLTDGDLRIQSSNNSNIFIGGTNRINPTNNGGSIGIGYQACDSSNLAYNVAIGYQAGRQQQGDGFPFQGQSVAVGFQAGESFQSNHGVALGAYAGRLNQKDAAVACGFFSGNDTQGKYAIAIGNATGQSSQGDFGVAIGASSGNIHQGIESLACGSFAGHKNLGYQSVALGHRASYDGGDFSNTIVINATGTDLDPEGTDRTYIKPIREQLNNDFLFYNSISGEVTRSVAVNFTSNIFINGDRGNENDVLTSQGTLGTPIWRAVTPATPDFLLFGKDAQQSLTVNQWNIVPLTYSFGGTPAANNHSNITIEPATGIITFANAGTYAINVQLQGYWNYCPYIYLELQPGTLNVATRTDATREAFATIQQSSGLIRQTIGFSGLPVNITVPGTTKRFFVRLEAGGNGNLETPLASCGSIIRIV